jgi:3-hydroxyacyl-[acyl-carrier-protein] dehydratase
MHFCLVDRVLEQSADRIVTIKNVSASEEYLQDHFPGFPVLPGVFMIEALVQAGRRLLEPQAPDGGRGARLVLGGVRALKYGSFVRPGQTLRVEVSLHKTLEDGGFELKGEGVVLGSAEVGQNGGGDPPTAVSGRFTLRPIRIA